MVADVIVHHFLILDQLHLLGVLHLRRHYNGVGPPLQAQILTGDAWNFVFLGTLMMHGFLRCLHRLVLLPLLVLLDLLLGLTKLMLQEVLFVLYLPQFLA